MQSPILPVFALGTAALLAACAPGGPFQQERRPGYERVLDASATTRGRVICSALDPRTAATVPGCQGVGGITNDEFVPAKGEEFSIAYSEGPVTCGQLRPEFRLSEIVPECFVWRKLPESGSLAPSSPSSPPASPSEDVHTAVETENTMTSVSITHDEESTSVRSAARAGNVNVSTERVTDTRTGAESVTFNEGTANEWSAVRDAGGSFTRVSE